MNNNSFTVIISCLILGVSFYLGMENIKHAERFVTVKGVAERDVTADLAMWKIPFSVSGDSVKNLQEQSELQLQAIIAFLKKEGVTPEEITYEQPIVNDKLSGQYGTDKQDAHSSRFTLLRSVSIKSKSVEKIRSITGKLDELLKLGIILVGDRYSGGPTFLYTKLNEIKPSMVEEATKTARTSALQFAKDSSSTVGKIRRANQGLFTIVDKDSGLLEDSYQSNQNIYKKVRVVSTIDFYLE